MNKKRIVAAVLAAVLWLTLLPAGTVSASGGGLSLAQLQEKYPQNAYWNHTGSGNNAGGYTWTPCDHHTGNCTYSGSCGCNSYKGVAIQCMGFAYQVASLAYDCDPRSEWSSNYSATALNRLKAGDIVRYKNNGHSIFVLGVSGDTVTYADCNSDHRCIIKWDQVTTKATLRSTFTYVKAAPYALPDAVPATTLLTLQYHANGGTIAGEVTGYRYEVTEPDGVNLRAGAGTGNPVLTALPQGATFTVAAGQTEKAGGYTWGKTTYNGTTGWLVISDFVEKTATLREGDYYLKEAFVHRSDTAARFTQMVACGAPVNPEPATTFNLKKDNQDFVGWSTQPEGEPLEPGVKAEVLCPTLEQEDATVTLYAVWGCAHRYDSPCATRCTRCGATRTPPHDYENDCDPDCALCGAVRETTHLYATPCSEVCQRCGAHTPTTNHTYKGDTCTVCGKVRLDLAITAQPKTGYAAMGEKVSVRVKAVGEGLTYQWYLKNEGQTKYYKSSVKSATYTTTMSAKSKNRRLVCYVYDHYGNRVQAKTVMLRETVSLTAQPKSATVAKGKIARVTIKASGDGLTYKWYLKNAGQKKYYVSSVKKATYSVRMSDKADGRRLICYVYDKYGNKVQAKTVLLRAA